MGYTCYRCEGETAATRGVLGACGVIALAVAFVGSYRFLSPAAIRRPSDDDSWLQRIRASFQRAVPLQAVKIIIASWQIITEVRLRGASLKELTLDSHPLSRVEMLRALDQARRGRIVSARRMHQLNDGGKR